MKHLNKGRKFGLKRGQRKSFLKILSNNLIMREKITTTEARAKELKKIVEKHITLGKKQTLASFRLLASRLPKQAAYKIYHELAPRYATRKGGYTRVIKQSKARVNDGSKMARIEFV
jgi:large subunit ribosomal protein L17